MTYKQLLEASYNGCKVSIHLQSRTLEVNRKKRNLSVEGTRKMELEDVLNEIERLYEIYKYSVPSKRSEASMIRYFKGLPYDELMKESTDYLIINEDRELARTQLEGFILLSLLNGNLYWDEEMMGKWYWQSKKDRDLIILKEWLF